MESLYYTLSFEESKFFQIAHMEQLLQLNLTLSLLNTWKKKMNRPCTIVLIIHYCPLLGCDLTSNYLQWVEYCKEPGKCSCVVVDCQNSKDPCETQQRKEDNGSHKHGSVYYYYYHAYTKLNHYGSACGKNLTWSSFVFYFHLLFVSSDYTCFSIRHAVPDQEILHWSTLIKTLKYVILACTDSNPSNIASTRQKSL